MNTTGLLLRARSALGLRAGYQLGGGAQSPDMPTPLDEEGGCDCSAFACWCVGLRKAAPQMAFLRRVNGGWYNTNGIWWDALKEPTGFFSFVNWLASDEPAARPGDLVVYPSRDLVERHAPAERRGKRMPSIGHVGLVATVTKAGAVATVIHCSAGNERRGDAIAETDAAVFYAHPATLVARCALIDP